MPAAVDQIHRVHADYANLIDAGLFTRWGELFTSDASFILRDAETRGRQAIVAQVQGDETEGVPRNGMHVISNISIRATGKSATVNSAFLYLVKLGPLSGAIAMAGHYTSELRLGSAGWQFAAHKITFLFDRPMS